MMLISLSTGPIPRRLLLTGLPWTSTAVPLASLAGDQVAKGAGSWRGPPQAARRRRSASWSDR